jgi:DGQHR domain-containing protein
MNMAAPKSISFPALKVRQPIGEFFIGVIDSEDLVNIAYADIRRIERERDVEKYLGIQRPLSPTRVKEIQSYVHTADATFPTAVILAVDERCAEWNERRNELTLTEYTDRDRKRSISFDKIAKILDGQHRLEGLMNYAGEKFELNVTIFIDADIAEQANIFATVNLAQTKVNKSLVYDLFDLAKARSPQKTCHYIAVALDQSEDSPFYHRIKRLGVATEGRFNETLTQATVVESILRYISRDPLDDRDRLFRGKRLEPAQGSDQNRFIFRNLFIDERDPEIAKIIWNYFDAVRDRWPRAWNEFSRGNILIKTNGFRAFMRFLRLVYVEFGAGKERLSKLNVRKVLNSVTLKDNEFNVDLFPPGSSGEAALYRRLRMDTRL